MLSRTYLGIPCESHIFVKDRDGGEMVNMQDLPRWQGSCFKVLLKLIYLISHQFKAKEIMTMMVAGNLILIFIGVDFDGLFLHFL